MASSEPTISSYWTAIAGGGKHAAYSGENMSLGYDIFRESSDGPLWVAEAASLTEAREKLETLARSVPAEYFVRERQARRSWGAWVRNQRVRTHRSGLDVEVQPRNSEEGSSEVRQSKFDGGTQMFAYLCRKCGACSSEFILEQMEDPGSGQSGSSGDTFVNNTCPNCRSDFLPESYFVLQSAEPLMQRMETGLHI